MAPCGSLPVRTAHGWIEKRKAEAGANLGFILNSARRPPVIPSQKSGSSDTVSRICLYEYDGSATDVLFIGSAKSGYRSDVSKFHFSFRAYFALSRSFPLVTLDKAAARISTAQGIMDIDRVEQRRTGGEASDRHQGLEAEQDDDILDELNNLESK